MQGTLQALISNAGFWAPDTAGTVNPEHAEWFTRSGGRSSQTKSAFIAVRAAVCEIVLVSRIHFAGIFQHKSIRAILIERRPPFN